MNWPPRLSEHPACNMLERKCRRLMGIISNERERMADIIRAFVYRADGPA